MRTDTRIDRYPVKCHEVSTIGYGKWKVETGDIIVYKEAFTDGTYNERVGRVAGRVHHAPAMGETPEIKDHLLVIALSNDLTFGMERWVAPEEVLKAYDPNHSDRQIPEFIQFFFSPQFKNYAPDQLRQWAASGYKTPQDAGLKPIEA